MINIGILFIYSALLTSNIYSQDFDSSEWLLFENEKFQNFEIKESGEFQINNYTFIFNWDSKLFYNDNIGDYGGISLLEIFENGIKINTFYNIKDGIALGNINFSFYDYNLDGYLDFTIPIDCGKSCHEKYYLYNPVENMFQHYESWDYLRIQKINKKNKQILEQPNGTATDGWQKLYQIDNYHLIELNKFIYGSFFKDIEKK